MLHISGGGNGRRSERDRVRVTSHSADINPCSTFQVVETADVQRETGLGSPHTSHCLASGEIMISCVGDAVGNGGKSEYVTLLVPYLSRSATPRAEDKLTPALPQPVQFPG